MYKCSKCRKQLQGHEAYEYRGAFSCDNCFDSVIESRGFSATRNNQRRISKNR